MFTILSPCILDAHSNRREGLRVRGSFGMVTGWGREIDTKKRRWSVKKRNKVVVTNE